MYEISESNTIGLIQPEANLLGLEPTVFNVTTGADIINDSDGLLSLREAIIAANAVSLSEDVEINLLPATTYKIERSTFQLPFLLNTEDNYSADPLYGDHDIRRSMTINGNGATVNGDDLGRVFQISGNVEVNINNLTILDGGFDSLLGSITQGGGMHVSGGADVLLNNIDFSINEAFSDFSSSGRGGALYADNAGGTITIKDGIFQLNNAQGNAGNLTRGGAVYLANGDLEVDGTVFRLNDATVEKSQTSGVDGGSAQGGAIYIDKGNVSLSNAVFDRNRASGGRSAENDDEGVGGYAFGGAVYVNNASSFVVNNSNFTSNRVFAAIGGKQGGYAYGGAIFLGGGTFLPSPSPVVLPSDMTIEDSIFQDNWAFAGGIFTDSDSGGDGGRAFGGAIASTVLGIYTPTTTTQDITIRNTLFEENRARGGGGGSSDEGSGGTGGNASGGAVWTSGFIDTHLTIEDSFMLNNTAVGGNGGLIRIGQAGDGGDAYGGAIYTNAPKFTLKGSLSLEGETGEADAIINASGLLQGNIAAGGLGSRKRNTTDGSSEDDAGNGGNAYGGAIATSSANTTIEQIFIDSNFAYGGNGGSGIARREVNPLYVGTKGGDNGDGHGGGLYVGQEEGSTRIPNSSLTITDSSLTNNVASGARIDIDPGDFRIRSAPRAGGAGGANKDGFGLDGGLGGNAYGGALDFTSNGNLLITGSGFVTNEASGSLGGSGGVGWNYQEKRDGGNGRRGGGAVGGAIRIVSQGEVKIFDSTLYANRATGGRGGSGGVGGRSAVDDGTAGDGGNGGTGGDAGGGALFISDTFSTPVLIKDNYILGNAAIAGDGGFGGGGGVSGDFTLGLDGFQGGNAGDGGDGGNARGGGVILTRTNATIEGSTIEQNVISSGFGGQGGNGGFAYGFGGNGGNGGDAGDAEGGGIFVADSAMKLTHSTVVQNLVASGFGGNGGVGGSQMSQFGGRSGNGGNGGNGGDARGGGVHTGSYLLTPMPVIVEASTIARNSLDAGGSGFGSSAGAISDEQGNVSAVPNSYQIAPFVEPFYDGANRVFYDGSSSFLSFEQLLNEDNTEAISDTAGDRLGDVDVAVGVIAAGIPAVFGGAAVFSGGVAAASIYAASGVAVPIGAVAFLNAGGTAITVTSFSTAGVLSGGVVGAGVFLGPILFLTVAGVVAVKSIAYGIATGDWEGALEQGLLGDPGPIYDYGLSNLFFAGPGGDDDETGPPYIFIKGANGNDGQGGIAEGTGIYGSFDNSSKLSRTIVSDNNAFLRRRDRSESSTTYFVTEEVQEVVRQDVVRGTSIDGKNFIGAVNSGFSNDLHGTTANPLSAKLDYQTQLNGGTVPTMKLLPLSPARQVITLSENDTSQNDYVWLSSEPADIGAWGGPDNRPPNQGEFILLTVKEDGILTIEESTLLSREFDPDLDPLSLVSYQLVTEQTNGTVTREGSSLIYTPAPDFFGNALFGYSVTDGEFTSIISVIVTVTPVNDAPIASDGTVTTAEDTWVDIDMRNFVTDIDTPLDLLDFVPIKDDLIYPGPVGGSVELLADGYTARFTPDENFNGDGSFLYLVFDPGNGYGPPQADGLNKITVSVTPVNDAPVNVLPDSQTVDEDELLKILGLDITDVDAAEGDNQMQVTLEVEHGILSLASVAGLTFENNADGIDDSTMTFVGELAAIQLALSEVSYKPLENFNGEDQLKITSNDLGNFGDGGALSDQDQLTITVNPVNDAPVLTVPDAQIWYEDVRLSFNDISVADVDVAEGDGLIEVTLGVEHGTLTLRQTTGLTFSVGDGIRNTTMTFTGTLEDVNTALLGMYYLGDLDYSGSDSLSISTNDRGNFGDGGVLSDNKTIGITLLSSAQQSEILKTQVNELYDAGIIDRGELRAMLTQLTLKGNINGDAGRVLGFIGLIEELVDSGVLTEEIGEDLIAAAGFLYDSVSNSDR